MKGLHQMTGDLIEVCYWTYAEHNDALLLLEGAQVPHDPNIYSFSTNNMFMSCVIFHTNDSMCAYMYTHTYTPHTQTIHIDEELLPALCSSFNLCFSFLNTQSYVVKQQIY